MNNIIRNQLLKVKQTNVEFNDDTTEILIPKTLKISKQLMSVGKVYEIELYPVMKEKESVVAVNWNSGNIPLYDKYLIEVSENIGKMVKVNGVQLENPQSTFFGWLPIDGFEILKEVKE